jgi:MFS superfamily sulfate permease-like transporter
MRSSVSATWLVNAKLKLNRIGLVGIPNAGLSAIIIHAVADLVASPAQAFMFWRVAPLEYIIWLAAVLVTIFSSIGAFFYSNRVF